MRPAHRLCDLRFCERGIVHVRAVGLLGAFTLVRGPFLGGWVAARPRAGYGSGHQRWSSAPGLTDERRSGHTYGHE
jgi:hypothetical protein